MLSALHCADLITRSAHFLLGYILAVPFAFVPSTIAAVAITVASSVRLGQALYLVNVLPSWLRLRAMHRQVYLYTRCRVSCGCRFEN